MDARDMAIPMFGLAIIESFTASQLYPGALYLAATAGVLLADAGQMGRSADDWKTSAKKLEAARKDLADRCSNFPTDKWNGPGRNGFNDKAQLNDIDLGQVCEYHGSVGDAMEIISWLYFALAVVILALATMVFLAFLAELAVSWTFFGAAALEAVGNALAGIADSIAGESAITMKVAIGAAAAILVGGGYIYTKAQGKIANPNGSGPITFQQAQLTPQMPDIKMPGGASA